MAAAPNDLLSALREMLDLSEEQKAAFIDARMEDLFICQRRREAIYGSITAASPGLWDAEAKAIARRISENDRRLALLTEDLMGELQARLKKLDNGRHALKAYGASDR